jgi:dextranase
MEKVFAIFPRNGKNVSTVWKTFAALLLGVSAACAADLEWAGWAKNTADNGILAPAQDLVVVVDSKPPGGATTVLVHFTTNGADWTARAMAHHGTANYDTHDRWKLNLGRFSEGTAVQYSIEVVGANQTIKLDSLSVTVSNAAAAIRWIGNLRTEPGPGAIDPGAPLRVFSEMSPPGVAVSAEVGVSTNDGKSWKTVLMAPAGSTRGNDLWTADLGGFPEGAEIRLYVRAQNANGDSFWDNNTGADYRLRVHSPIRDVTTAKARYNPGETASILVDLNNPGPDTNGVLSVRILRLAEVVAAMHRDVALPQGSTQTLVFPWQTPTDDFQGYGVDVDLVVGGKARDSRSSAIDVSSDWTRFPRMGFFSEYPAGDDAQSKAAALAKFHLNAIQFYDWKWTHDRLVPIDTDGQPLNVFTQVGGRVQSFQTVKDKIAALHARNMAALSYTLMYGDSGNDTPEHVEWAAFKKPNSTRLEDIRRHDAGTYKIWVMDVSNPEWKAHIFGQFRDALAQAGFDGIHLDNLGGDGCYKYNSDVGIPEREEFPNFIAEARAALRARHPRAVVTHNDVMGNYLPEIARSDANVYYSEVWSRHTYRDLRDNVLEAQAAGHGKPVVLAAYINRKPWDEIGDPAQPPLPTYVNDASAKLLDACLFAHGAFHIELGDDGQMLVNEYFPARTPRMHAGLQRAMRDYYDFAVRYENLLADGLRDVSGERRVSSATHRLSPGGEPGAIWTVARERADGALALNLINLNGVDDHWRNPSANPTPQSNIALQVRTGRKIQRIFVASPDDGLGRLRELPFHQDEDGSVACTVSHLLFWNLVVLFPEPPPSESP